MSQAANVEGQSQPFDVGHTDREFVQLDFGPAFPRFMPAPPFGSYNVYSVLYVGRM